MNNNNIYWNSACTTGAIISKVSLLQSYLRKSKATYFLKDEISIFAYAVNFFVAITDDAYFELLTTRTM